MLITIPTKKGSRILFESSRVNYLLYKMIHNLRLKFFPPKNVYTLNSTFMTNLPTHFELVCVENLEIISIDGHCIAIWDESKWRGIIELNWAGSPMELYHKLNDLQIIVE